MRERILGYVVSGALGFLVLMPLAGLADKDSFPISTYPMFAARRGQPLLYKLVATFPNSRDRPIPPELVAGGELLQAKVMITRAVRAGPKARRDLCRRVAVRVREEPSLVSATEVQVHEVRYDALEYFTNPSARKDARILERCRVPSPTGGDL